MTNASTFSPFVTDFLSTSAMPLSNSSWSSTIHPVGAAAPAYIGSIQPVRRVPGTGGFNPYGYDEQGGTGFPAPIGNNLLCLLALTIIYLCIKRPPKLYHKSWQRSALIFFVCVCCFSASAENGIIPVPTWEPLPKILVKDGKYRQAETMFQGVVYEKVTHFTVCYSHTPLVDRNNPRLVIEVDEVVMGKLDVEVGDSLLLTFHLNLPAKEEGYAIMIYGENIVTGHDTQPITLWAVFLNGDFSRTMDIYYFANPEFADLRHEMTAQESLTYDRWRAHRIFTPGAWEPFCMPLPIDRVYTHEDNGDQVDLVLSTYAQPDGHYWIRSFDMPCVEEQVGSNWLIPEALTMPEAGVGYIFMVPDDPWWSGREICFEGRFVHGGGETLLTDDYSESTARFTTLPDYFTYVPNTTFLNQPVAEGWLPNIPETQGRYFDNHGTSYTLHPMECHLIGGSATAGIARIGTRDPSSYSLPTALTDSPSASSSSSASTARFPSKILHNGHLVILRDGRSYNLLGHSQ